MRTYPLLGLVLFTACSKSDAQPPDFSKLIVKAGKTSVKAVLGYHCWPNSTGSSGSCDGNTKFPLVSDQPLVLRPRQKVEFLLGANASEVDWGLMRLDGNLLYHGTDLYGDGVQPVEVRRRIGMVFQKPNPFPKTIYDNVAWAPRVLGL